MPTRKENAHTEKACGFIRYQILSGSYPPGFRLKTVDLARESGVSRTPVREALRQLQQEGLVDIKPRLGARVRSITFLEFKEMCELRLAMESFAAELAAQNRGPEDLVEMEDALQQMSRFVTELEESPQKETLVPALAQHDIHFHLAILNAAGNSLLRAEVLRFHLFNKLVNINYPRITSGGILESGDSLAGVSERRRYVFDCHRRIFDAIVSQQPETARNAMHEHLKEIIDRNMVKMARRERSRTGGEERELSALHASV
jgi:DNA-binding GntR family transcriptional regulator